MENWWGVGGKKTVSKLQIFPGSEQKQAVKTALEEDTGARQNVAKLPFVLL